MDFNHRLYSVASCSLGHSGTSPLTELANNVSIEDTL